MSDSLKWTRVSTTGEQTVNIAASDKLMSASNDTVSVYISGYIVLDGNQVSAEQVLQYFLKSKDFKRFYNDLAGQFWLAICQPEQPLILVNDVVGAQMCYYYQIGNDIFLSSSLRAIKAHPQVSLSISKQALYHYIYFHCIPSPTTIYNDTFKLEPGTAIFISNSGEKNLELVYSPQFASTLANENEAHTECLRTIDEIVAQQSGQTTGAFLSGGLDSSTVAGMLAKNQSPAKTFSIGFKVAGYDETEYALITSEQFSTEHQVLYLEPDKAAEEFVSVAQYFDEPFGNSSAMAAFFCAKFAKEHGMTTLLAGDGGDELFAGNERYAKQKVFEFYYKLPNWLGNFANFVFNNKLGKLLPVFKKIASYLEQARVKLPARLQTYNFVHQLGLENIFSASFLDDVDVDKPIEQLKERYGACKSEHPVDQMLFLDWKNTLADNDLVKVTKMCEMAGVEVRFPLLDKRLIDFSCSIPADIKLPGGELRDFYKKSCKGFLADQTLTKSKHGFGLPFGAWMKENAQLKSLTDAALESFKTRNIVKPSLIDQAMEAHNSVHTGYFGELIWIMVVLELWLQKEEPNFSL